MPAESRHAVVIGASAGGLDAVRTIIYRLPRNFRAPLLVVIHTSPEGPGLLAEILDRVGPLRATTARHAEPISNGHIYVAPPDSHLVIDRSHIRLTRGPREHRFRPAIDPLFRSAAQHYGDRVIGIVLSGNMADGTHGLMTIKSAGGIAIVQDPQQAEAPMMPMSALQRVKVDYVLPTDEIGRVVTELVMNGHGNGRKPRRANVTDPEPSAEHPGHDALETGALAGPPSPFTCPDCGGTLWELTQGGLVRYRCHVGHSFSAGSLVVAQDEKLEDTLWSALRALEESIELRKRLMARAESRNLTALLPGLRRDADDLEHRADVLRTLLLQPALPDRQRNAPRRKQPRKHGKKTR
jgi:two-component system chemotaxis response regulator CheB